MKSERHRQAADATGRDDVDDAMTMIGRFRNGALASLEATRFAPGRKNSITLEINGNEGSLFFDLEDMNRLKFFSRRDPQGRQGFRDILVTEPTHPYMEAWWPPGHIIGYEHTFIHTIADFVRTVAAVSDRRLGGTTVRDRRYNHPDFADALETQRVLDAVLKSAKARRTISL